MLASGLIRRFLMGEVPLYLKSQTNGYVMWKGQSGRLTSSSGARLFRATPPVFRAAPPTRVSAALREELPTALEEEGATLLRGCRVEKGARGTEGGQNVWRWRGGLGFRVYG